MIHAASEGEPQAAFKAAFPSVTATGTPQPRALQIVRELEHGSRGIFGGAVGYVLPDGSLRLAAPLHTLSFQDGQIEIGGSVVVGPGFEGDSSRRDIEPILAAVRSAQDALEEREKAEELMRARREKAESEKAASELAASEKAEPA